ncbi:MAG: hypothetical protein LUE93_12710 [Bacteroides sp.]|nr:hypothetical protein [Bacteroides sp.]
MHLDCRFTFYSSKPFYHTQGTGAVFLNCDIEVLTGSRQYFTKAGGQVALIDTRFTHASDSLYIGWMDHPPFTLRCYQYNVTLNEHPVGVDPDHPGVTVDLTDKPLLKAYRIEDDGKVIYNTYNLLRGDNDWDPAGIKEEIRRLEKKQAASYSDIPVSMKADPGNIEFTAGESVPAFELTSFRGGSSPSRDYPVHWELTERDQTYLSLEPLGSSWQVSGVNGEDLSYTLYPKAVDTNGLEGSVAITVNPPLLEAPLFIRKPQISGEIPGVWQVNYAIDRRGREDQSIITWYRCSDEKGNHARVVAVSRLDRPEKSYVLTEGDIGSYIMAKVEPRHLRSLPGEPETVITPVPVKASDVQDRNRLYTDFRNFPTAYQPEILPGFWTVDGYKPLDVQTYEWQPSGADSWFYGKGVDGAVGYGLLQTERGARLLYTPVTSRPGNMSVELVVDPCKTAGQGFGSATGQYMDIYIKFDTYTLSGYALRIERTPKNDRAVDFSLVRYKDGVVTPLTEPVTSVCYRTDCRIRLEVVDNRLKATAFTTTPLPEIKNPSVVASVELEVPVEENGWEGTGVQHTGSAGGNATMLHEMCITWGE